MAERRSLPLLPGGGDGGPISLRQRLLGQPARHRAPSTVDGADSFNSDDMDGQLNSILAGDRDTPKFTFKDIFSPRRVIQLMWNSLHRATFGTICVLVLLWAAVFIYVSFYYVYVPALDVTHAIHFQFDTKCKDGCGTPSAHIQLSQYKQPTFFATGQSYRIAVHLDVPESDINWDQGMFMLKIALNDNNQNEITTAARSGILRYKTPLLRLMYTVVYWPLYVTGFKTEMQQMTIPLIEHYVDGIKPKAGTATAAVVTLEAREFQVYSSKLIVQANLTGLRFLMVHWPILTGIVSIATIFSFLAMITVCGIYRAVNDDGDDEDDEDYDDKFENADTNSEFAQSEAFSAISDDTQDAQQPDSTFEAED